MWDVVSAQQFLAERWDRWYAMGYLVYLSGGVLHRGHSDSDLDIVFIKRFGVETASRDDVLLLIGDRVVDAWGISARSGVKIVMEDARVVEAVFVTLSDDPLVKNRRDSASEW